MIVIICAKYKKNPSITVDATERTRFSKSRLNDLEDIGQGQRSSHATHLLMLLIICTKYGKNPSWTVDATGRTRKVNRQTDGQTDRVNPIYHPGGYKNHRNIDHVCVTIKMGQLGETLYMIHFSWRQSVRFIHVIIRLLERPSQLQVTRKPCIVEPK